MYTRLAKARGLLALPHLVDAAKRRELITYKQLASKVGCHHRALSYPLGYIRDDICRVRGLPMLTAIVINQGLKHPGDSWLPEGAHQLPPSQNRLRFEAECERVFACQEWDKLLDEVSAGR